MAEPINQRFMLDLAQAVEVVKYEQGASSPQRGQQCVMFAGSS
jgi:hypothetical protein